MRVRGIRQPVVWWIGEPPDDDLLRQGSELLPENLRLRTFTCLAEAERCLRAAQDAEPDVELPELLIVHSSRPGETGDAELARLRALAPLARIWRVAGSWCEGEQRTGRPPQGCTTSYWHQFVPQFNQDLQAISEGSAPSWQLPVTAHADERPLADAARPLPRGSGLIAIVAGRSATAEALSDACRLAGYETLVVAPEARWQAPEARAVLWDTTCEQLSHLEVVERLRAQAGGAPLMAVVGFPRPEDVAGATAIAAVVSKPYRIDDLLWELQKAVREGLEAADRRA